MAGPGRVFFQHFLAIYKESTLRKGNTQQCRTSARAGYICFLSLLSFDLLYSDFVCLRYMSLFTIFVMIYLILYDQSRPIDGLMSFLWVWVAFCLGIYMGHDGIGNGLGYGYAGLGSACGLLVEHACVLTTTDTSMIKHNRRYKAASLCGGLA